MPGPRLPRLLARLLLPARDREVIVGDLEELHALRLRKEGRAAADRRYAWQVLASVAARRLRSSPLPAPPTPDPRRVSVLADLPSELLAAVRALRRQPAFTAVASLTLAIGVGATAVGFAMVNQLILRPLPGVKDPAGAAYVQFAPVDDPADQTGISLPDFDLLRERATLVEGMASYGSSTLQVSLGTGRPVDARANLVYGDFFEILGVLPARGRMLTPRDTELSSDPFVAVISERLWGSLFDRAPDVVGRTFNVSGRAVTVLGVAGGGFEGPERGRPVDVWIPWTTLYALSDSPVEEMLDRESISHGDLLLRPRAGVTPEAVQAQIAEILAAIAASVPESAEHLASIRPAVLAGLHAPPLFRDRTYRSLTLMSAVVGLVLLIACANVANLLLFRSVGRRGEVATRRALGASTARVARQLFAESLVLACLGTALGLGFGWLLGLPFQGLNLVRTAPFEGLSFDGRVLLFAGGTALATAVLFGSLPAVLAGRFDLGGALSESGMRETGRRTWLRAAMSATQIALSVALVVGATLLLRTLANLYAVDTGLDVDRVASLTLDLNDVPEEEQDAIHRSLIAAVEAVPGVEAAALDIYGPFSAGMGGRIRLPEEADEARRQANVTLVTPGWFELLGVVPTAGRTFRPDDWAPGASPRVVITEGLARTLFGTTDVVGRRVVTRFARTIDAEVVGVVGDLRLFSPNGDPQDTWFQVYEPFSISYVTVLASTRGLDAQVLAGITAAVEAAVPQLPVPAATALSDRVDGRLSEQRLFARMIGLLGGLSALLSAVGLYGVLAFTVAGRRRELGIRLALGAHGRRLAALIARYALGIVAVGMAAGLAAAYALSRFLEGRLFGVTPADPLSYLATALFFALVAAVACWAPTRAAMRVDPMVSLRGD